jgi:hypothetical protein
VTFPQYEIPIVYPRPLQEIPTATHRTLFEQESSIIREKSPTLPPRYSQMGIEPPVILPKTNRVRSPPVATRTKSIVKDQSQNIYQEIDSTSTDDDQGHTPNADLQFIRGAIERVFHFHGGSTTDTTSESSTHYEEVEDDNQKQYPAVEAVQRFYHHKNLTDLDKPITNLDNSSTSKKTRSAKKIRSKSSSETSSEEVDDTLNDIEVISHHSPPTSSENSSKTKKSSQQTQTIGRVCNQIFSD